ncbi:hypothetical protein E3N88_26641 [Mikania micrantha]|uniref:Uncharacterized protein n=1 Tax=Mikania micrantha TaxID=192012 RepID=A0A5N6MVH4_9ASTR|nr:hypothetical protein E3N88_26641 [Mikania micrantha]
MASSDHGGSSGNSKGRGNHEDREEGEIVENIHEVLVSNVHGVMENHDSSILHGREKDGFNNFSCPKPNGISPSQDCGPFNHGMGSGPSNSRPKKRPRMDLCDETWENLSHVDFAPDSRTNNQRNRRWIHATSKDAKMQLWCLVLLESTVNDKNLALHLQSLMQVWMDDVLLLI